MPTRREPVILGDARFDSVPFSNVWHLRSSLGDLARLRRVPSRHITLGTLEDRPIEIRPEGWGTVVIVDQDDRALGSIHRRSWWGRRWEIAGTGFSCELVSEPRPRRWSLRIGGHRIARVTGAAFSYNRLRLSADLSVPAWAALLVWHVVARPWEAAAAPRALRAIPAPRPTG